MNNHSGRMCLVALLMASFTMVNGRGAARATQTSKPAHELHVDRAGRKLYLLDDRKNVILTDKVGVGKGGLRQKKNMDDSVTPTGIFHVDLILYKDRHFNRVSLNHLKTYCKTKKFNHLLESRDSLAELFTNMNSLDFDGDGRADRAYGDGYIGLTSTDGITGPKMQLFGQTPYWCSIALHGTSDPKSIDLAQSGGCVHLRESTISKLICSGLITIGTRVMISDRTPLAHQATK